MREPEIVIHFDDDRRLYQSGEALAGHFELDPLLVADAQAVELSVLWYTEGQGDEDLAVHHFQRFSAEGDNSLRGQQRFSTLLPNSPLSYDGILVRIYWTVRVRVFLARGKEIVVDEQFRLGNVPASVLPEPEDAVS
jgi:hypothetical protein